MIDIFTTKDNLESICLDEGKRPWLDMIIKLKEVFVNDDDIFSEDVDPEDDPFYTLDGMQVEINSSKKDYINEIPSNPVLVLQQPSGIFLLDISSEKASQIQKDYGVICNSVAESNNIALTEPGWDVDTSDESKEKSWKFFLSDIHTPLNAIVIVDRYFFSSEKNKTNVSLNESINDSYSNIKQILEALLPPKAKDEVINVAIVYDHDTMHSSEALDFKDLMTAVNKIKKSIVRSYAFTFELISLTSDCYQYKETHDRFIISNYFIVNATHKIKAYRTGNISLENQILHFNYLFSKGIKPNDKSSLPMATQDRVLNAIRESLSTSKNIIRHGYNGQTSKIGNFSIINRLLL